MIALAMFFAWFAVTLVLRGVSLDVFWDWFIVNTGVWPAAPDLTVATAIGLSFFVSFLFWRDSTADREASRGKSVIEIICEGVGITIVFYAWFWLVALFLHYWLNIGA